MESLPSELSTQIFEHLTCRDQASLRLTNHKLHDLATPLLFQTVPILPFEECFTWLEGLRPEVKLMIRGVLYFNQALPNEDFGDDDFNFKPLPKQSMAWNSYQSYQPSQKSAVAEIRFLAFFMNSFRSMPRLTELEVVNFGQGGRFKVARECSIHLQPFLSTGSFRYFDDDLRLSLATSQPHYLLAIAAHVSGLKIRSLSTDCWEHVGSHTDEGLFIQRQMPQMTSYLAALTELTVAFRHQIYSKLPGKQEEREKTARILASAGKIESMVLCFALQSRSSFVTRPGCKWLNLTELTQVRQHWPKLKILSLEVMRVSEKDFIAFLIRHAETLRELRLSRIDLLVGLWGTVVKAMQNSLKLHRCSLEILHSVDESGKRDVMMWKCCSEAVNHRDCLKARVERYIVQGGEWPEPLREAQ